LKPTGAHFARYDSPKRQCPVGRPGSGATIIELLQSHLMDEARKRTIRQAVAGGRFCAVRLDDGGVGVANLCPDVCGEPSRWTSGLLPPEGAPATEMLEALAAPERSAIGVATANALANRPPDGGGPLDRLSIRGDLLEVLELRPDDHVGMVGCFSPLVDPIRRRVRQLSIFERGARLAPGLLDENQAGKLLPDCSVALITATTLMNGTIDALLAAAGKSREIVLLGPSTPLVPEVFARSPRRATLLAGVVVTDPEELLHTVVRGGGTRDFKTSVAKVNVRVSTVAGKSPLA
jgi:uncharacterized protein (DUF4213/DUF364 family)